MTTWTSYNKQGINIISWRGVQGFFTRKRGRGEFMQLIVFLKGGAHAKAVEL
jgi:hypothetical protein